MAEVTALIHINANYVLLLITAKLVWENTFGKTGTAQLIGSPVLTEAHLIGAIGGVLCGLSYLVFRRIERTD